MTELEQKKIIIHRIISKLDEVPPNAVNELLRESLTSLEEILIRLATRQEHEEIRQDAETQIEEMRRSSKADAAWAHCLNQIWLNGKRLADVEANRQAMEAMLQPHEQPSAAIYKTIALSDPTKFSWEVPRPVQTEADREAEFMETCRKFTLSLCSANRQLHKDGVGIEHWAGASGVERQQFQAEAALARQDYLIHHATPGELKAEAKYQFHIEHAAAVQADAERREKFVADQQRGLYPMLPTVNGRGETMDAAYFRRISTVDRNLFKALVKRHGTAQVTARLRGEV